MRDWPTWMVVRFGMVVKSQGGVAKLFCSFRLVHLSSIQIDLSLSVTQMNRPADKKYVDISFIPIKRSLNKSAPAKYTKTVVPKHYPEQKLIQTSPGLAGRIS